eukprot:scaffold248392_cov40-Cyclotella_meneghiniana.AAC.2
MAYSPIAAASSLILLLLLSTLLGLANALATAAAASPMRSYVVTGANKGQGYALCKRILSEHDDTHVFLCSRDVQRGNEAKEALLLEIKSCNDNPDRIDVVQLDVTSDASVRNAVNTVKARILTNNNDNNDNSEECPKIILAGVISNAGILWGYPLPELMQVCATGVKRVLDAFVPMVQDNGRVIVVTSGLGPLIHSYASQEHQTVLKSDDCTWEETILPLMQQCNEAYTTTTEGSLQERIAAFDRISFPGGPFADSAPDFHMYGLSKMFGDAYMLHISKQYPKLRVVSVDPGLVYTDLILKMPKYAGKGIGETTAQSPEEGVEAHMRLLFDDDSDSLPSGKLYAMKDGMLVYSDIDKMPQKQ